MHKSKLRALWAVSLILMLMLIVPGCSDEGGDDSPTNPDGVGGLPADPGPGNLAGKVIGTISGQPLSNVIVSVGTQSAATGSDGTFRLDNVGEGILAVFLSGNTIYSRTVAVSTADGRSVPLDAIEMNSNFHLGFYRELARGNHPQEGDLYPTHRWVTNPTFFINTNSSAALDGVIDQDTINTVRNVLNEVVPIFTGGFHSSVRIETRNFATLESFANVPANSFIISFDDSLVDIGAYGITFTEPDFISPATSTINKTVLFLLDNDRFYKNPTDQNLITFEEIIAHEAGHGHGFRHTSLLPSVMVKVGEFGGVYSTFDRLHMAIMYARPGGNTDIDNDPIPEAKMIGRFPGRQVFVDQRANIPTSPDLLKKVRALNSFGMVRRYIAENH
ncbi:hypothetical protein GF339_11855 [candidate division KSB3 bacterium]|uniref:Peptidase M10 metallopeptidase domain-containing protein n=1 Tax=candidate division KSB3 bacterium TaxID=2044937 RepID=A0A9D5Q6D0_9BACT|nr:hypothetical protein [candidate division KSB3 bacterium]MBD3325273.1 hypothetical protein [candidate division KSB3 bacterium]